MKLKFHPEALKEYLDAVLYYSEFSQRAAESFIHRLESAIRMIHDFPKSCPIIEDNVRRKVIQGFPFSIYYCIENEQIRIYAVLHTRQQQDWKSRKKHKKSHFSRSSPVMMYEMKGNATYPVGHKKNMPQRLGEHGGVFLAGRMTGSRGGLRFSLPYPIKLGAFFAIYRRVPGSFSSFT